MNEDQTKFENWARVEVMGHQTHIGYATTQAFGAAVMFRVDQPEIPGETGIILKRPQQVQDGHEDLTVYAPAGSEVERKSLPAATVLIGAGSIYRIIPCTQEAAMKALRELITPPLILVKLAEKTAALLTVGTYENVPTQDDGDENGYRGDSPF